MSRREVAPTEAAELPGIEQLICTRDSSPPPPCPPPLSHRAMRVSQRCAFSCWHAVVSYLRVCLAFNVRGGASSLAMMLVVAARSWKARCAVLALTSGQALLAAAFSLWYGGCMAARRTAWCVAAGGVWLRRGAVEAAAGFAGGGAALLRYGKAIGLALLAWWRWLRRSAKKAVAVARDVSAALFQCWKTIGIALLALSASLEYLTFEVERGGARLEHLAVALSGSYSKLATVWRPSPHPTATHGTGPARASRPPPRQTSPPSRSREWQ